MNQTNEPIEGEAIRTLPMKENAALPVATTPDAMIMYAMAQGVPIEQLERLYALKQKYDADEARKAYVAAMADFKRNPPRILKQSHVSYKTNSGTTDYYHANLGDVCDAIVKALATHGFSHSWDSSQDGNVISVTCRITHAQGHSESFTLSAAPDQSGGKNAIQAVASTNTYLQRYTLLMATGLAAEDADDDGYAAGAPSSGPNPHQAWLDKAAELTTNDEYAAARTEVCQAFGSMAKVPNAVKIAFSSAKERINAAA